jgi:hypothetical protein
VRRCSRFASQCNIRGDARFPRLPPDGLFCGPPGRVTVGIIALPLAIGFGIASGVTPQKGFWTGIVAGLVLGGSQFQIAGPTGAFVPVLFAIVAQFGYGLVRCIGRAPKFS